MSIEVRLIQIFNPLVNNRVWWDVPPDGYVIVEPIILLETAGGDASWYVGNELPDKQHARVRVSVWAKSRLAANAVARAAEAALAEAADENLAGQPYGAFLTAHDSDLGYYGTHQDFGFWYPRP